MTWQTKSLGYEIGVPIYVAMARLAHPTGGAGTAKACRRFRAMQIISNNAPGYVVEGADPGQVFGWQPYVQKDI